jgi:hypothetical protein
MNFGEFVFRTCLEILSHVPTASPPSDESWPRRRPLVVPKLIPLFSERATREEGPLHHPPPRQGHLPLRRHQLLPIDLLALLARSSLAHPFATSPATGLVGFRTTFTLKPETPSAHLLPLPSYPASSHRCFRRESPVCADPSTVTSQSVLVRDLRAVDLRLGYRSLGIHR